MKVFVVLAAFFVVALAAPKDLSQEQKDPMKAVHKKCQDDPKTKVDEDFFKKIDNGEFPEDNQLKVHMLCVHQGIGVITQEGKCNEELLKSQWPNLFDAASQEKLQKCLVNKETALETSWALLKCEWAAVGDQIKAHHEAHEHHH